MTENHGLPKHQPSASQRRSPKRARRKRCDRGTIRLTDRDEQALHWIGEQYAIRLDHLQRLLGRTPGRGAHHSTWIDESSARDVVNRWKKAGWVLSKKIHTKQPFWVWLTTKGLRMLGLSYKYFSLSTAGGRERLDHLYAVNTVRLAIEDQEVNPCWISDRHLAMGVPHPKGQRVLHRPDGEITVEQGQRIAIEVELSSKGREAQEEILLELLRGRNYLTTKARIGTRPYTLAKQHSGGYDAVWYFATPQAMKKVAQAQTTVQSILGQEEANRIQLYVYPLTSEEEATGG